MHQTSDMHPTTWHTLWYLYKQSPSLLICTRLLICIRPLGTHFDICINKVQRCQYASDRGYTSDHCMGTHFDICLHIPALLIYTRPLGIHMEEEDGGREGRDIQDWARERYVEGGRYIWMDGGREYLFFFCLYFSYSVMYKYFVEINIKLVTMKKLHA